MAATTTPLLTALLGKATLDDHDELLKASNAALKKSKSDAEAQHVKVVALLKLERYEQAVKFIEDNGDSLKKGATLEYAYGLYKIGRLEEAASVASGLGQRGGDHVEAQARYRLEDTATAAEVLQKIRAQDDGSEDYDLRINLGAIEAQSQWLGTADPALVRRPGREDLEAFETTYNAACGSLAGGEFLQAQVLLKRAKELCKHSEDLTEEQRADELLPICVQQLYVLQSLGKEEEAKEIAAEIKVDGVTDLSTRKIAQNNILLIDSQITNPFMVHKTLHSTPKIPDSDRLFSYQAIPLASNQKAVDLQTFKFSTTSGSKTKRKQKSASPTVAPEALLASVFNAAAHAQAEVGDAAIKKVLPELEKHPNDVGLIVTLVQMYVLSGNTTSAIELMEMFFKRLEDSVAENEQEIRFNPGLVSIVTALYRSQGRRAHVRQELAKAATYWRHKSKAPSSLLHAAGASLLESSNAADTTSASDIFGKLREQQPNDKATIAGYVASRSLDDADTVKPETDKISSVAELTRNIDVDALEEAGIPQSSNALAIAQLGRSRKRAAPDVAGMKPKRIRKSRLPKDYDPSRKPDPERWLPLRDRSTYRPRKKKGRKAGDDRTQGGAVNEDLNIDAAKPSAGVVTAPSGGGGGKKKKGKGKK